MLIELTKSQYAVVDDEDYKVLSEFNWYAQVDRKSGKYTACRGTNKNRQHKKIIMHRVIMDCPNGLQVDHINQDTLDNRRCNLRICTQTENNRNRKRFNPDKPKGCYQNQYGTWTVRISVDNKDIVIGNFKTKDDAEMAYKDASIKYHGEFSCID